MSHASLDEIRAVQRDAVTREALSFKTPAERALYLHIVLEHKRSAIVGAGIIETHKFKRALDAHNKGRMVAALGQPKYLHDSTEENLILEIRKAQESGRALSKADIAQWVFLRFFIFYWFCLV
jgi:hypothetical protein